ncbi:Protein ANTAGONIST OF LIKE HETEROCHROMATIN PROTEIN 1 [Cardamine amara subsp. amara]|uniref:Protein ANTAGONIST OF LIKE HETEROCHROMATIN PROTEIN 1 n=1 Tax=Cardamine amara subsp. amara TaxID=228776 RepID=A0ABD1C8U5_CARAN
MICNQNMVAVVRLMVESERQDPYCDRQLMRTDRGRGLRHTMQLITGSGRECYETIRMNQDTYRKLCNTLKNDYILKESRECIVEEAVAMFLETVAHDEVQRQIAKNFQRSQETVNRKFMEVLDAVLLLSKDILKPQQGELQQTNNRLLADKRYWPFFSGCIGALDGTHVSVRVQSDQKERYWNSRKQFPSMNVLAICNFDMKFIYAYVGTPGRAHDTKVLTYCAQEDVFFPKPPDGKYFVVDSGYPNRKGYLAPYRKTRYHPHQWGEGPPNCASEMFNKRHSSLRSVIERSFGVWKTKWRILKNEARYGIQTQCKIVVATMTLHNFIRESTINDEDFEEYETMDEQTLNSISNDGPETEDEDTRYQPTGDAYMSGIRNTIAEAIWNARR